jgi:DNA helicase II / ATP-dependent DNA helicase PcrA
VIDALRWLVDTASGRDNPEHALLELLGPQDILLTAPAGCGKTQALATRAKALVASGAVAAPHRILALTFSNRATDNLRSRLRVVMGVRYWDRVTVTNFHGFARRLILAHGESIGVGADVIMPQRGWLRQARAEAGITWRNAERVDAHLRDAKSSPRTDAEVIKYLKDTHDAEALRLAERLRDENRLDYDDLLRYADLILAHPAIARLYACHFPVVLVDELQDLTHQQLRIATSACGIGITTAGDQAQGIYAFAGADPDRVFDQVRSSRPAEITFRRSYRSAPRVLDAVNALARLQDAVELECADPDSWPDEGHVLTLVRDTRVDEANALVAWLQALIEADPTLSVGVIARRGATTEEFVLCCHRANVDVEIWADATHNPQIVRLLKRNASRAEAESEHTIAQIDALEKLCRAEIAAVDIELLDDLADAIFTFRELAGAGSSLQGCLQRCRQAPPHDAPVAPGTHVLTAHTGKGQQFDWVIALGVEQGKLPDFRASTDNQLQEELRVFHVMVSRARRGVMITRVHREQNQYGRWFGVAPSDWWDSVGEVRTGEV